MWKMIFFIGLVKPFVIKCERMYCIAMEEEFIDFALKLIRICLMTKYTLIQSLHFKGCCQVRLTACALNNTSHPSKRCMSSPSFRGKHRNSAGIQPKALARLRKPCEMGRDFSRGGADCLACMLRIWAVVRCLF